jgi:hypothetical protein
LAKSVADTQKKKLKLKINKKHSMLKNKLHLRNLVAIAICLAVTVIFSSCEKIDYNKLEGTTWEAATEDFLFTLRFVNESECTLLTARNDGTCSANLIPYVWRYASDVDSRWGLFHLYNIGEEADYAFPGTIENKKLFLGIYADGNEGIWFKRADK